MKNSTKVMAAVLAVVMIAVCYGAFHYYKTSRESQQRAQIYQRLVEVLDDFHQDIKKLSASAFGTTAQEELRKMKEYAGEAREKIETCAMQAVAIGGDDTVALREGLEKAKKYLEGYGKLANQAISGATLEAKAEVMLDALSVFRLKSNSVGSPDEGDTSEAIARAVKLAKAMTTGKGTLPSFKTGATIVVVDSGRYWSNPAYTDYHRTIRDIVANYSSGRKVLARVLNHYDRGAFTSADNTDWSRELVRRRELLRQLDSAGSMMPSGSIYDEHHRLLRNMLSSAIAAMESFSDSQDSGARRQLSAISRTNSTVMERLKRFYGIR